MIKVEKLLGVIAENRKTQKDVADAIGVSDKTFYLKMKKGVFGSDEIDKMIQYLHIEHPEEIFLVKE